MIQTLRHSRVGANDSEVVDLSAQKEDLPVDLTSVDLSLVWGAVHDIEIVEDPHDVFCP
jgi:hypothetical protein